ncbi:SpaH/EbpB family LPXTG-anchored major pilin [Leucobacter aridicollis]|uniref:Gram-positive pilin subunit D1 N-terminal domain-containing protein n=1 Tax=Leucobacter aridicollis TaxID=283878 RepID=A0A852RGF4_9MICO|nr:SpaH/EbpB family LPXTG-anchored major pilin [Leucobacter aridicollis]NYD28436.1 hypothetical protein [Leucobacter aridicollis]
MNSTSRPRRALALLGVAAIAAGALGVGTAPAMAAPGDGGTGSITVHKHEYTGTVLGPNDGTELDLSGQTVNGLVAGFTVCAINGIDLSKSADWKRVNALVATGGIGPGARPAVTEGGTPLTLSCGIEKPTRAGDGVAKFDGLSADRAYVVYESTPPANALQTAQPTIVTVPLPSPNKEEWNYHPHIYPKNSIVGSGATKGGALVTGKVSYGITVPIKPLPDGEQYWEVRIDDQLSEHLVYDSVATARLTGADGKAVSLVVGVDYTVTPASNVAKTKVELVLLAPGLAKYNANIGGKLVLSFRTGMKAGGSTANRALITLNGVSSLGSGARSSRAANLGGPIEIENPEYPFTNQHYRAKDSKTGDPIAGVGFTTYLHPILDGTSCPADPEELREISPSWWELAQPWIEFDDFFVVSSPDTVTTDAAGFAHIIKWNQGTVGSATYCAYVDVVPDGYRAPAAPTLFKVTHDDMEIPVLLERSEIKPGELPALPVTGAAGTAGLIGGGAVLLLAAGVLALRRGRVAQQ